MGAITLGRNVRVGANSVVVSDVPDDRSVVGIPARIVAREVHGVDSLNGVDLNHHLIPDPVGRAISCLLERIDHLEAQLQQRSAECASCGDACELTEFDSYGKPGRKVEVVKHGSA